MRLIDALAEFVMRAMWIGAHVVVAFAAIAGAFCVVMWFLSGMP